MEGANPFDAFDAFDALFLREKQVVTPPTLPRVPSKSPSQGFADPAFQPAQPGRLKISFDKTTGYHRPFSHRDPMA